MASARIVLLAVLAILLPTIIFASVLVAFDAHNSRLAVEAAAIYRARQIMNDVDADLARSTSALRVLATTDSIEARNWEAARARAKEISALNRDWRSVSLLDLRTGEPLFTTDDGRSRPLSPKMFDGPWRPGEVTFGGIARREGRCTCALVGHQLAGPLAQLALIVELDPAPIQQVLLAGTPPGAVSAVVDRTGMFIGRSLDIADRLGTPATIHVRRGLGSGAEGLYPGRTYEGLENLSAFSKSPLTGWSTHMAVSSDLIAAPQQRLHLAIGIAALLALLFAAVIIGIMLRYLSARRAAEARLRDAQHLEALGRLTGGVAHDFNNMLAVIVGNLDIARRAPDLSAKARRHIEAASQGAERAADLTRRMLAYARRQDLSPDVLDPCEVVVETGALLDRTIGDHIRLRCASDRATWPVRVDRSQLQNALVNLAINARDAMPEGGDVTIEAGNVPAGALVAGSAVASDSVVIRVSDTGQGIAPDLINRVTDPFFTTKDERSGTGLGLSQVLGFARQSGGDLRIASTMGEGTHVHLILPRHRDTEAPARRDSPATDDRPLPRSRIMLVEDDERVLATTLATLSELGQEATPFASGDTALAALKARNDWDLIITDNQMPGMSGLELISAAREIRSDLPALLVTALPVKVDSKGVMMLAKPFSVDQLRGAILALMAGGASEEVEA